ncbi:MAG: hypothetical protein WAN12_07810 [Candidatus Acidiferrum sp.]
MKIARIVLLLTLLPGLSLRAEEKPKVIWSVDLRSNGVDEAVWNYRYWGYSVGVAANASRVVVAYSNPSAARTSAIYEGPWEVRLIVFDVRTGRLLSQHSQRGPWRGKIEFMVRSTADGNFLLLLDPINRWGEKATGTIVLLSADGEELKRLDLEYSQRKGTYVRPMVFQSSSGRNLLVESRGDDAWRYQVLSTDTLETRMQWTEAAEALRPATIAISDEEILATDEFWAEYPGSRSDREQKFYARKFGEAWTDASRSGFATGKAGDGVFLPTAFLNNQDVVGQACNNPKCWRMALAKTDGSIVARYLIPRSLGYTAARGRVSVTMDGRYFATELFHESSLSHWWNTDADMWSFGYKFLVYVWDAKDENPIAKITFDETLHGYCFVEGETPALAALDGPNLKLLSIDKAATGSSASRSSQK